MTREQKIDLYYQRFRPRWCTAAMCACMGCDNKGRTAYWIEMFPGESKLTEQEVNEYIRRTTKQGS